VDPYCTILHDEGKTIRLKLDSRHKSNKATTWSWRKAKRNHFGLKNEAKDLIIKERQQQPIERKQEKGG
jgi:hypothetical protein